MRNVILIGASLLSLSALAQQKMSLNEAIAIALEKNLGLQIIENNEEMAQDAYQASAAGFLPKVDASASNINTKSNVKQVLSDGRIIARDGARSSTTQAGIGATYTIFDGLKMFATREKSRLQYESAQIARKQEILNTVEQVTLAYSELVRLKQQLLAYEELMKISEERIKVAEKRLTVGVAPKTEVLQSKVDYNAQLNAYRQQKALVPAAQQNLKRLLGSPELNDIAVEENLAISYSPNMQLIKNGFEQSNYQATIARNTMLAKAQEVKELRASLLPRLDLVSAYNYSLTESQAGLLLTNQNNGFNYGFTLAIPLFRGFSANKGLQIARLSASNASLQYQDLVNTLNVEMLQAYSDFKVNQELLALEEDNLLLAKENVSISLERFRQSQTSILELREAQFSLGEAQTRLISVRYKTKAAELRLRNLSGDLVK